MARSYAGGPAAVPPGRPAWCGPPPGTPPGVYPATAPPSRSHSCVHSSRRRWRTPPGPDLPPAGGECRPQSMPPASG